MTFGKKDPLTGSGRRDDIFVNPTDAAALKLDDGGTITLRSSIGELRGRVRLTEIRQGNLQA